jgi:hypothetical protein
LKYNKRNDSQREKSFFFCSNRDGCGGYLIKREERKSGIFLKKKTTKRGANTEIRDESED